MKFSVLLFFLFTASALRGEVFFVPGWRTGFSGRDGCVRILKDAYPGEKITVKSWDSLQPWGVTKRNAAIQTGKLIKEILSLPDKERRELILVGHSIGAQIVVDILCELERRKLKVHSVALIGAALADDDPRIERSLNAIRFYCSIVYNPDDWVLKYLFPLDNAMHSPLGLYGWTGSDYRVFESRAVSDRFGFFNHFAYIYLEELDRQLAKLPPERPEVTVMQGEKNVERRPADELFWDDIATEGGWKLQKSCFGDKYRILDDHDIRRAQGSKSDMEKSFADVCRQLNGSK